VHGVAEMVTVKLNAMSKLIADVIVETLQNQATSILTAWANPQNVLARN
jgi:hypothetical protein